jgi:hypothetical protein
MSEEMKIQPEEVTRDALGSWTHSRWPKDGEEDAIAKSWFAEHGLDLAIVELEYEPPEVADKYFEDGGPDFSYWQPTHPEGEGWFIFSIHDSDDGPVCVWVRNHA